MSREIKNPDPTIVPELNSSPKAIEKPDLNFLKACFAAAGTITQLASSLVKQAVSTVMPKTITPKNEKGGRQ